MEIGDLLFFPDGLRKLNRKTHDGLILDDVRDLQFLSTHQEKLQGSYNRAIEFASTQGGTCAFRKDLYRLPIVVTINNSTKNLQLLETNDFLSKRENARLLCFSSRPGQAPPSETLPTTKPDGAAHSEA